MRSLLVMVMVMAMVLMLMPSEKHDLDEPADEPADDQPDLLELLDQHHRCY